MRMGRLARGAARYATLNLDATIRMNKITEAFALRRSSLTDLRELGGARIKGSGAARRGAAHDANDV